MNLASLKSKLDTGAAQSQITISSLNPFRISLPSLQTQNKIAYILSAYDNLINANNKRIKLFEELAQRTYEEWFVNFRVKYEQLEMNSETKLPIGWKREKLGDIADFKYGKMPITKLLLDKGYPIFSGYRITGYYPEYTIDEPSIIIVARGVGGTGDVKLTPRKCWLTNLSILIKPKEQALTNKYFLFFKLKNENMRSLDSGAAISQITIDSLKNYQVVLPTISIQEQFKLFYSPIAEQVEFLQYQNHLLKESQDLLLPRLMSGKINVLGLVRQELEMAAEPQPLYKRR